MRRRRGGHTPVPPGTCSHGHDGCPTWIPLTVWCTDCQAFHCTHINQPDLSAWERTA